jgi:hypothetical protein
MIETNWVLAHPFLGFLGLRAFRVLDDWLWLIDDWVGGCVSGWVSNYWMSSFLSCEFFVCLFGRFQFHISLSTLLNQYPKNKMQ